MDANAVTKSIATLTVHSSFEIIQANPRDRTGWSLNLEEKSGFPDRVEKKGREDDRTS